MMHGIQNVEFNVCTVVSHFNILVKSLIRNLHILLSSNFDFYENLAGKSALSLRM